MHLQQVFSLSNEKTFSYDFPKNGCVVNVQNSLLLISCVLRFSQPMIIITYTHILVHTFLLCKLINPTPTTGNTSLFGKKSDYVAIAYIISSERRAQFNCLIYYIGSFFLISIFHGRSHGPSTLEILCLHRLKNFFTAIIKSITTIQRQQ